MARLTEVFARTQVADPEAVQVGYRDALIVAVGRGGAAADAVSPVARTAPSPRRSSSR